MIYIYSLNCPSSGNPRYIGKCVDPVNRLRVHIYKARSNETKSHCANWIRSLLSKGLKPTINVLKKLPDGGDWQTAEAETISEYRRLGHDLTNATSGGDGFPNLTPDVIAKRSSTQSEKLRSPEVKAKILGPAMASHARPEVRANHSRGASSAWADPVKRQKMLDAMRTPEALARRREATMRRNANPEFAAKHRAKMKSLASDPKIVANMARARAARWERK